MFHVKIVIIEIAFCFLLNSGSNLDKCDVFSESDPFFTVSKVNPDGSDTIIYRSDYIKVKKAYSFKCNRYHISSKPRNSRMPFYPFSYFQSGALKDNPNPEWPPVTMTSNKLCNGDYERPLKVEIWDYDDSGKHDFIGEYFTNVTEVILISLIISHNAGIKNFL